VEQQARNLVMDMAERGEKASYLIKDGDTKFTEKFDEVFKSEGIKVKRLPYIFEIPQSDIHQIESILRVNSAFCFPIDLPSRQRYSLVSNMHGREPLEKWMLLDRNILSDIGNFFSNDIKDKKSRQLAVAISIFMRLCGFLPAALPALEEFESLHSADNAYTDVTTFGKAFCAPIERHLDLLNGRSLKLEESDVPATLLFPALPDDPPQFMYPDSWLFSYIAVLRITSLERDENLSGIERMQEFLKWLFERFIFTYSSFLVASQFFGVRRERSIMKGLRTDNAQKLRRQVRNAGWDLNILHDWQVRIKRQEICVLASRDDALRKLARKIRTIWSAGINTDKLLLCEDWPNKKEAALIMEQLNRYLPRLDDSARPANLGLGRKDYEKMVAENELELGISGG
jgi:hypothetical protein